MRRVALLAVAASLLAAPRALPAPDDVPAAADGWRYQVTLSPALDRLRVTACFADFPAQRLVLDTPGPAPWIEIPAAGGPATLAREADGEGFAPTASAPGGCVAYEVDLARLEREQERGAYRRGKDLVARVGLFLLRPARMPDDARATLDLELPAGVSACVPWPAAGNAPKGAGRATYRLDGSAFGYYGFVAFGRFAVDRFEAGGTAIEAATLDGAYRATGPGVRRWLSTAATTVAALYGGRFPRGKIQAVVHPSGPRRGGDAVTFGASYPGGGAGLMLFLASDAGDDDLPGEWVAVHEMVHLTMPVIAAEDAWFSEGIATYYQEVLRARSGAQDERGAWQAIEEGFQRGRSAPAGEPLLEASKRMKETHGFHRVYWSGAAAALLVDVEARRRSGGARSLDDAMRAWSGHTGSPAYFSAEALGREADGPLGAPLFGEVAAPILAGDKFPDLAPVEAFLGIRIVGGAVALDDAAPGAAVRRAIMARAAK